MLNETKQRKDLARFPVCFQAISGGPPFLQDSSRLNTENSFKRRTRCA